MIWPLFSNIYDKPGQRQAAINRGSDDQDLQSNMESLGHSELNFGLMWMEYLDIQGPVSMYTT